MNLGHGNDAHAILWQKNELKEVYVHALILDMKSSYNNWSIVQLILSFLKCESREC